MMSASVAVTAPYNFVPLSEHVCIAKDLDPALEGIPSQDHPVEGGLSGRIDLTLTAHSPILVNWSEGSDNPKRFGSIDGVPHIPGSSLRGMVRNVLEIASFGRMGFVDDARTSLRDLNAVTDYRSNFTRTHGAKTYESTVFGGWLQIVDGRTVLIPCDYARVDHRDTLSNLSVLRNEGFRKRLESSTLDTTLAENVQRVFLEGTAASLDCSLWVDDSPKDYTHSANTLRYRKAAPSAETLLPGPATRKSGTLVFTGMPSAKKHMEFFFFDEKTPENLPEEVMCLFLDVHERQEKVSPTWRWRQATLVAGGRVPVFFIRDGGRIRQIGLSMMFKMASECSIHSVIANTSREHLSGNDTPRIDLVTRIFGRIDGGSATTTAPGHGSFRSRVSFGWAGAVANTWREGREISVHLQRPKPGFFPSYIRQHDLADTRGDRLVMLVDKGTDNRGRKKDDTYAAYRTYMNWSGKAKGQEMIRGWKRYPVLNNRNPHLPAEGSETSGLVPIEAGPAGNPRFTACIRYHNLHPVELGALIWALTWGGDASLRHSLGMGRPLGWGQLGITADLSPEQRGAVNSFEAAMEKWAAGNAIRGGWARSIQIRQLKAMADPAIGDRNRNLLKQMVLDPGNSVNGFVTAKKQGQVLPEYDLKDVSVVTDGPNPAHVKGLAELNDHQQREAKQFVLPAVESFKEAAKTRQDIAEKERHDAEARAKAEAASLNAEVFPPGAKVRIDGGNDVRIVLQKDGNNYRIVSRRADGTGREKVNVQRLTYA